MRALLLLLAASLAAQEGPRFDIVAVRVVPPNPPILMRDQNFTPVLPGGQFVDPRINLWSMIAFAYHVPNASLTLVGLPKWAEDQSYTVAAKAAPSPVELSPAANREQVRLMMRAMLAERFHLQLHTETRQERVLRMQVAKGGIKLHEVDPPVPPAVAGFVNAAVGNDGGRMIGKRSNMAGVAAMLMVFLKRPVIDETGVQGYYDFDLKWKAADAGQTVSEGFGPEGTGLLISALQNLVGVRLVSGTGPVEFWVVDHVEPPSEN
jgi:uncharacterized protein (TIGR03435 family)